MSLRSMLVVTALSGSVVCAQEPRTGVSHPDANDVVISQDSPAPFNQAATVQRPLPPPATTEVFGEYVPYRAPGTSTTVATSTAPNQDVDGAIVTAVEERPGELREGTLLRARMLQSLSTQTAEPGTEFSAALTEPVSKDGRVIFPSGAVLHGRVTAVHSGHRISGPAMLHLEAKSIDLPDGTRFPIHALLIDTDQINNTKVDREGSLVRKDHPKETLAAMGLAVGGATTAGAMLGGGVGALVGAGVGASAGTIVWLRQDRQASVPANALLVFSLSTAMSTAPQTAAKNAEPVLSPDSRVVGDPAPVLR